MSVISYSTIKAIAAEKGARVADLLALAPANDPFYTGRPSEMMAAEWFAGLWAKFGYGQGIHLRRIHYQIVSQSPLVIMPGNKKYYRNTMRCWNYLNNAAKWARYLGLVPARAFVDRRNPAAITHRHFLSPDDEAYLDPTPGYAYGYDEDVGVPEWDAYGVPYVPELPALPDLPPLPITGATGYYGIEQPYLIEIWAEKTTMNDILLPLCQQYHINLITGAGELSITAVLSLLQRMQQAERPARILYVSDFDPAGMGMPISVARKIEFYQRQQKHRAVHLEPVVLTAAQVDSYKLPRVPVKDSDRRKANWERDYGRGQTELDALEALHPGELHTIVEQTILKYYDKTLVQRAIREREQLQSKLNDLTLDVHQDHRTALRNLNNTYNSLQDEYTQTRNAFDDLVAPFQRQLNHYEQRMDAVRQQAEQIHAQILEDLQQLTVNIAAHPLPDPELPDATDDLLYMSGRGYAEQLQFYKHYRHNTKEAPNA